MFKTYHIIVISTIVAIITADNVGWKSYFIENPKEFHDIPLVWEKGNQTTVPSWLSGIYVRNGPAQVKPKKSIGSSIKNYVQKVFQSEVSINKVVTLCILL